MDPASGMGGVGPDPVPAPFVPGAPPAAPVPENASFINSVAFLNVSSRPSAPAPAPAEPPSAAPPPDAPNIEPISPITSSSLVFSSLSSMASNNFAVSPNEPISERLFTMENRISWRYFQMISLVLSVISSVAQISRKSTPGRNSLTPLTPLASFAGALSAPFAPFVSPARPDPFVSPARPAPLSLLALLACSSWGRRPSREERVEPASPAEGVPLAKPVEGVPLTKLNKDSFLYKISKNLTGYTARQCVYNSIYSSSGIGFIS